MRSESEVAEYMQAHPERCVFLHTTNCLLYCHQCDIELGDATYELVGYQSIEELPRVGETGGCNYLELRKLFVREEPHKPVKGEKLELTGGPAVSALQPLNALNTTLVMLYSVDYVRKMLKKMYVCGSYAQQHYGIRLFPRFLNELSAAIFGMNKGEQRGPQFERLYMKLLKLEPDLGTYRDMHLHVR